MVSGKFRSGIVVSSQLLFRWDHIMDCLVACFTNADAFRHFFPCITLFEPLVRMNSFGNEVVEVIRFFTLAKFTDHGSQQLPSPSNNIHTHIALVFCKSCHHECSSLSLENYDIRTNRKSFPTRKDHHQTDTPYSSEVPVS